MILALLSSERLWRTKRVWRLSTHNDYYERVISSWSDEQFLQGFRMSRTTFEYLSREIYAVMTKKTTHLRECIPAEKRIAIALHVLVSSAGYRDVAEKFGIGKSTTQKITHQFCNAICNRFGDEIAFPTTEEELKAASDLFVKEWQFPQCIGALCGSHIAIVPPRDDHEDYFNDRGSHSIVLLATVDACYRFTYVNVGYPGKANDGYGFCASQLYTFLIEDGVVPNNYHLVANSAFPLHPLIMKPYTEAALSQEETHYNYRLARARSVAETAFRRLKGRWRILNKKCDLSLSNLTTVVKACSILHNIVEDHGNAYLGEWEENSGESTENVDELATAVEEPEYTSPFYHQAVVKRDAVKVFVNDQFFAEN